MRLQSITRRPPLSRNSGWQIKVGEKERICVDCALPEKDCNGDCKRFHEEIKNLKENKTKEVHHGG